MHPVGKILIGILLLIGSAWWVLQGSAQYLGRSGVSDFVTVLNGALPPLVFLIGLFIVWLEYDELKIERELRKEERRRKKR
ncbi:MAG: hypothetical protein QXQ18_02380 [Candidatus Aenigmatarchaeota archaeon]